MRRYLLAFFAQILFQESEKESEQKFKVCVLLVFLRIVIPFYVCVFFCICNVYVISGLYGTCRST